MIEWRRLLEQTHPDFQFVKKNDKMGWISSTRKLQNQIESIPDRLGFKIGEVADHVGVKQYVLRYWESEFNGFQPEKSKNGQRIYTKRDMETALIIKKLLHEDRFSIEGAKSALNKLRKQMKFSAHATKTPPDPSPKNETPNKIAKPPIHETKDLNTKRTQTEPDKEGLKSSAHILLESIRQARTSLNL